MGSPVINPAPLGQVVTQVKWVPEDRLEDRLEDRPEVTRAKWVQVGSPVINPAPLGQVVTRVKWVLVINQEVRPEVTRAKWVPEDTLNQGLPPEDPIRDHISDLRHMVKAATNICPIGVSMIGITLIIRDMTTTGPLLTTGMSKGDFTGTMPTPYDSPLMTT